MRGRQGESEKGYRAGQAHGRRIGLNRVGLYKALSENGNPSFATVMKITRALGLKLRLEPIEKTAQSTQ